MSPVNPIERFLHGHAYGPKGSSDASSAVRTFVTISRQSGAGGHSLANVLLEHFHQQPDKDLFGEWEMFDQKLGAMVADDPYLRVSVEALLGEEYRRASDDLDRHGPGYALVFALPSLPTVKMGTRSQVDDPSVHFRSWKYRVDEQSAFIAVDAAFNDISSDEIVKLRKRDETELSIEWDNLSEDDQAFVRKVRAYTTIAKLVAILSHLAIVVGIIAIGYWHFQNVKMGIGAATLYLMLPYTSQMTGRVDHALPAAFLVWALLTYRRPLVSGIFMGLAIGVIYYPLFLLPLW